MYVNVSRACFTRHTEDQWRKAFEASEAGHVPGAEKHAAPEEAEVKLAKAMGLAAQELKLMCAQLASLLPQVRVQLIGHARNDM